MDTDKALGNNPSDREFPSAHSFPSAPVKYLLLVLLLLLEALRLALLFLFLLLRRALRLLVLLVFRLQLRHATRNFSSPSGGAGPLGESCARPGSVSVLQPVVCP
jgi:hypothetical protein